MEEAKDLVPPDVLSIFYEDLQEYRDSGDNAKIEMYVLNGHLHTYWSAPVYKTGGKKRRRRERLDSANTQRSTSNADS